jgi:phage baseplate assembly protein W
MSYTNTINSREVIYSDLNYKFRILPNIKDLAIKKDVDAVKQSVMNILLTNRGEKPFEPLYGGSLRDYLFENFDMITAAAIRERIRTSIVNYEPRVEILSIELNDYMDRNALRIKLELKIISPEDLITSLDFIVERLR